MIRNWLVVWNMFYFLIGNLIIPTDFHIFQRGGPTTNQILILNLSPMILSFDFQSSQPNCYAKAAESALQRLAAVVRKYYEEPRKTHGCISDVSEIVWDCVFFYVWLNSDSVWNSLDASMILDVLVDLVPPSPLLLGHWEHVDCCLDEIIKFCCQITCLDCFWYSLFVNLPQLLWHSSNLSASDPGSIQKLLGKSQDLQSSWRQRYPLHDLRGMMWKFPEIGVPPNHPF